ncbi:MAG TPA: PAS domain S-box protein [Candidatus Paceibacterota bacterium]|nr:PAS domain S-box protein [Verrucomicrobiota bacterium]HRY51236.1 PAS domain S-box protein [Candidatus Paceibacterota bacterium]
MLNSPSLPNSARPPLRIPTSASAAKIAFGYGVLASLWILISGRLLHQLVHDDALETLLETAKGWLFVWLTAFLLWLVLARYFREIRNSSRLLQESENRYRALFENQHAMMFILDPAGGMILDANQAACQFYGWSREQMRQMRISDINPLPPDQIQAAMERARKTQSYYFQFPHRRADGSVRDVEVFSGPVMLDGREALYSIVHDITSRRQAEMELRKWADAFENCAHGIALGDPKTNTIFACNPAFARMLDRPVNTITGSKTVSLYVPEDHQQVRACLAEADGAGQARHESRMVRPDGSSFPVQIDVVSVRDADDKVLYRVATAQDITERKRAEAKLAHSHALMQYIIEHDRSCIAVHDRDLRYIYVSQHYLDEYKVKDRNVIGRHHYDVFPDLPQKWREVHQRALAGEVLSAEDDLYVRDDGTVDWTRWECRPWFEPDGSIGGIIVYTEVITPRKRAEAALQDSEERLRLALDAAQMGTFDWDISDRRLTWSVWHEWLWGYQTGEFDGTYDAFLRRLHPEDRPSLEAELERCKTSHTPFRWEFRVVWPDGSVHWMSAAAEFNYDPEGVAQRMRGTVKEVTPRKRMEEELCRSEQRLRALFDAVPESVFLMDANGVILAANAGLAARLRRTVEKCVGTSLYHLLPPHLVEVRRRWVAEVMNTRRAVVYEELWEQRWLNHSYCPVIAANGDVDRIVVLAVDVTERKRAEQALQQSHAMIVKLTAQVPGVVYQYRLSPDGRSAFPFSSPGMNDIYEVTPEEVREDATPVFGRLHPDDYDRIVHDIQESARTLAPFHCEFRVVLPRQGLRWRLCNAMPERTEDGGTLWHGIISDITQRKRAEAALQQRNEELIRFVYTVSHDLKSPLVTIQTFLGYLEKDLKEADAGRTESDIGYIRRAATKMQQLLEELLELSRIGRKANPPEDVSLQTLVQEALDLVAGAIATRGVEVRVTDVPVLLRGDRRRLLEVFQNLLDNAVKFLGDQPSPRIEIGVEEAKGEMLLFVRDNGSGIDPRHQTKLFGLFEKLHPGTPGSGIGLALVKRIVEVHGGRIWAESSGPGQGATFRFTLNGINKL